MYLTVLLAPVLANPRLTRVTT